MYQSEKEKIIQTNENEAFAELEKIIADKGWTATATPPLTHYDATLTAPDGKQIYVELKKRNGVKWDTYPSAIALKVNKAKALQEIQSETGVKVYVLIIYEENKYLAVSLDDLLQENNVQMHRMKKNEWEKDGETDFFKCYDISIEEKEIKKYN